jgi:hypothetical protein
LATGLLGGIVARRPPGPPPPDLLSRRRRDLPCRNEPRVPVGIDGESVLLDLPVT